MEDLAKLKEEMDDANAACRAPHDAYNLAKAKGVGVDAAAKKNSEAMSRYLKCKNVYEKALAEASKK